MNGLYLKIIGGVVGLALLTGGVLHYRNLVLERDLAQSKLSACETTGRQNERTIEVLRKAEEQNARRYRALVERSNEQAEELARLEAERQEETNETIRQIVVAADGDDCANTDMPRPIRLRLTRDSD